MLKKLLPLLLVPSLSWAACTSWSGNQWAMAEWLMNEDFSVFSQDMLDTTGNHPLDTFTGMANATTNVFEGGHGLAVSGAGDFYNCTTSTCNTNINHFDFGACAGGANAGFSCQVDGDCPSSTCTLGIGNFTICGIKYPNEASPVARMMWGTNSPSIFGGFWLLRDAGPVWTFNAQGTGGAVTVTSAVAATNNQLTAICVQRFGDNWRISINGADWETTASVIGDISNGVTGPNFILGGIGNSDYTFIWRRAIDIASARRQLVCKLDATDCSGTGASYTSCVRHAATGGCGDSTGIIAGTMTACDAEPVFLDSGPTTTTTVTTTSTSVTTSTSSSTSSTSSTSTTSTSVTTSSSTSTSVTTTTSTSLATTTSTSSTTSTTLCIAACSPCVFSADCCTGVCGMDGFCKAKQGHVPASEPECIYYNKVCESTCECCGSLECQLTTNNIRKCRQSVTTTSTSTSTSTTL